MKFKIPFIGSGQSSSNDAQTSQEQNSVDPLAAGTIASNNVLNDADKIAGNTVTSEALKKDPIIGSPVTVVGGVAPSSPPTSGGSSYGGFPGGGAGTTSPPTSGGSSYGGFPGGGTGTTSPPTSGGSSYGGFPGGGTGTTSPPTSGGSSYGGFPGGGTGTGTTPNPASSLHDTSNNTGGAVVVESDPAATGGTTVASAATNETGHTASPESTNQAAVGGWAGTETETTSSDPVNIALKPNQNVNTDPTKIKS